MYFHKARIHTVSLCYFADVNECESSPCHNSIGCTNTRGSYVCNCSSGYHGNGTHCQGKIPHFHQRKDLITSMLSINLVFVYSATFYASPRATPTLKEIGEMPRKNQSPSCRSGKRKGRRFSDKILGDQKRKCLVKSDRPKQFEDTRESGKKKIGLSSK